MNERHRERDVRAVIFDFDGTLTPLTVDFDRLRASVETIALRYLPREALREAQKPYILETIFALETILGDRGPGFAGEALESVTAMEIEASLGKGVYPYTRDVLKELRERGVRTAVITRTSLSVVRFVFPDFGDYLDAVVARDHTRNLKPDPDHVSAVLSLLDVPAQRSLVVGDHPTDIVAGKGAGARTAAVLSGRTAREAFLEAGATHILEDIRGILAL